MLAACMRAFASWACALCPLHLTDNIFARNNQLYVVSPIFHLWMNFATHKKILFLIWRWTHFNPLDVALAKQPISFIWYRWKIYSFFIIRCNLSWNEISYHCGDCKWRTSQPSFFKWLPAVIRLSLKAQALQLCDVWKHGSFCIVWWCWLPQFLNGWCSCWWQKVQNPVSEKKKRTEERPFAPWPSKKGCSSPCLPALLQFGHH